MEKKYTIQNYVIFGQVMKKPNIAKICIERVLGIKVKRLEYIETEKSEKLSPDMHGIRMDVYCENDDAVYNIEMQAYRVYDIGKRSRYYQDMMDMNILEGGQEYSSLKKNIVIFICTFDPFEEKRHIYTFENRCIQSTGIKLKDDTQKIVLNTKGELDDIPKSLKMFLDYIETDVVQDEYTKELDEAVIEIQNDERWRKSIMTVDQVIKDAANAAAEDALLRGIEQGIEQGEAYSKRETALRMLKHGNLSDEFICEMADITPNELSELKTHLSFNE